MPTQTLRSTWCITYHVLLLVNKEIRTTLKFTSQDQLISFPPNPILSQKDLFFLLGGCNAID